MRVLMTTDTIGGVWTYSRELVEGLLNAHCEVTLVSMGRAPSAEQKDWAARTASLHRSAAFRYVPTSYKLEWMHDSAGCFADSKDLLLDLIESFSPDVIHSNQFCYGALATAVPKVVVAHSDVLSWHQCCRPCATNEIVSADWTSTSAWMKHYLAMVTAGLEEAAAVVAPTRWMLRSVNENYGPLPRMSVIPNGRAITATRRRKNLQAITVGRLWDEAKNVRMLETVDAPMPIIIAGDWEMDGEPSFAAGELASSKLASGRLKITGRLAETGLLRLMAESAIYIATSRYEPFGLAPLEAALSGCAIVANDIPSLREVWGNAAVYFKDAESLSCLLTRLSAEPALLAKMAARAKKRATAEYKPEDMTARYLELYRSVVTAQRSSLNENIITRQAGYEDTAGPHVG